jgi:predicted DNA-binding antitoxin AbrB/MazE fold protein
MTTAVKAVYENGVFKPKEPVDLQEKTEVEVLIPTPPPPRGCDDPTDWKAIEELIGFIKDAPPDMAENHDFYLYGLPRK